MAETMIKAHFPKPELGNQKMVFALTKGELKSFCKRLECDFLQEIVMKKKIIGFTAGAFDMFHIGHLNLLKNAKARCDYLIVGVNTDELILSYKIKPVIVSFQERVEIIDAIRYVDETVLVNTLDKEDIWKLKNLILYLLVTIGKIQNVGERQKRYWQNME